MLLRSKTGVSRRHIDVYTFAGFASTSNSTASGANQCSSAAAAAAPMEAQGFADGTCDVTTSSLGAMPDLCTR